MNTSTICVIGGGPVGCALGVMLCKEGFKVHIYERYMDIRISPPPSGRSINLVLTNRGLRLANSLNLLDELIKVTVKVSGRMMHPSEGSPIYQAYGLYGECNYSIDRLILNQFWLNQAEKHGCKLFFGHSIREIDCSEACLSFGIAEGGLLTVPLSDFRAVFASDGGGSVVRKCLAKANLVHSTETLLSSGYKEVVFPAHPDGSYVLDPHALHIWPRDKHMLMALANQRGSFTGTIYMENEGEEPSFSTVSRSEETAREFLSKYYSDALGLVDADETVKNFVSFKQGILGTVRCSPWLVNLADCPVCLIGDAAHAIVPFFGQGVNCGFEDVHELMELMRCSPDLNSAISSFSETRKRNSDAIADLALENFEEMRSRVGDSEFLFLKKLDGFIMDKFKHKYRTRYTLVMYSNNNYWKCKRMGEIQHEFLKTVVCVLGLSKSSDLSMEADLAVIESLIDSIVTPHVKELEMSLDF